MCGIIGLINADLSSVKKANACQNHRGPDGSGIYINEDDKIGLGHTRLSIIDTTKSGHQPMSSNGNDVIITFNGEIYNYKKLKENLVKEGFSFNSSSDTEVLLKLYLLYGKEFLSHIDGIFALGIWDNRTKELIIARDAIGVKPLYYTFDENGIFGFASEIKALLKLVRISPEINLDAVHKYLTFLWCPGETTLLKSVLKLKPGSAMVIKNNKIIKYWDWYNLPVFKNKGNTLSLENSVKGIISNLRNAVHSQMVSDVPLGAFLSGGLDSSAIVVFAKEINPNIECFTISNNDNDEEGFNDDLPYAKRVSSYLEVPLNIIDVNSKMLTDNIEKMIYQLDEPLADPAALNVSFICSLAKRKNIKVLLSGAGGDDIFSGYRRHLALKYEKWWRWLPGSAKKIIEKSSKSLDQRIPLNRRIKKLFNGASLDGNQKIINYFKWMESSNVTKLFNQALYEDVKNIRSEDAMVDFLLATNSNNELDKMLSLEQRFFLTDHNLNYTDKMSMSEGVEVRVPFLDPDLMDFAYQIPNKYKVNKGQAKWILKKAMESYLPKDVIYRPKAGFGAPLRGWLKNDLRNLMNDTLSKEKIVKRGLFSPSEVHSLISNNDNGKIDASYNIFSLMCIELWFERFID